MYFIRILLSFPEKKVKNHVTLFSGQRGPFRNYSKESSHFFSDTIFPGVHPMRNPHGFQIFLHGNRP